MRGRAVHEYAARVDAATPSDRDRYVDLLRGVAICMVVLGHWLAATAYTPDGRLDGTSVLALAEWTHWFTWPFQVMPIFFLVGGYANATSWRRHAARGGGWPDWVHRRSVRLLRPTAVFVGSGIVVVVLARLGGADPSMVDRAGWVAGIALWFLAVYVAVAGLTPLTHRLHERFGGRTVVVLAVAVAAGDLARIVTHEPAWASANFVLGWALVHQVGYWWRDGALPSRRVRPVLVAGVGAAALVALVTLGPWPVAMVDVPGARIQNSSPPSLALLALAAVQAGLAWAVAGRARAWLRRPLPWSLAASVNRVVLTLFLWHMTAVVLGAVALHGTGLLAEPEPGSAAWLAWRPVWIATLASITALLVGVFAPVEQGGARAIRVRRERPALACALAGLGTPLACVGLAQLTLGGIAGEGPLGIPVLGLGAFSVGCAMTVLSGWFIGQPQR